MDCIRKHFIRIIFGSSLVYRRKMIRSRLEDFATLIVILDHKMI